MGIVRDIKDKLADSQNVETELSEALREAERLSDVFQEVRPQPYVVPIERFAGLPVYDRKVDVRG